MERRRLLPVGFVIFLLAGGSFSLARARAQAAGTYTPALVDGIELTRP